MATKKLSLGRNLNVLLNPVQSKPTSDASDSNNIQHLAVDCLQSGAYQPRRHFDHEELQELTASIKQQGVIQPLVVRPLADTKHWEIIAGERRWRAAKQAGLTTVPVVIRQVNDADALAIALVENIQRQDLNPLEQARALHRLAEEFSLTHQQTAELLGKSRPAISNLLRLLDLSDNVKPYLEQGALEMGHARALLSLAKPLQEKVAKHIVQHGLSVRQTEALIKRISQEKTSPQKKLEKSQQMLEWEKALKKQLGTRVNILSNDKKGGKLLIHYHDLQQLEAIIDQFI